MVFGDADDRCKLVETRLAEFFEELGADGLTDAQRHVGGAAQLRTAAVLRHRLGDLDQWEGWLRTVADQLGQLRKQAAATSEVDGQPWWSHRSREPGRVRHLQAPQL